MTTKIINRYRVFDDNLDAVRRYCTTLAEAREFVVDILFIDSYSPDFTNSLIIQECVSCDDGTWENII